MNVKAELLRLLPKRGWLGFGVAAGGADATSAAAWITVTNVVLSTNAGVLTLTDPVPWASAGFYRVEARVR